MYEDEATTFSSDEFWSFNNLLDYLHEQIYVKWTTEVNDVSTILSFVCHGEHIQTEHKGKLVDRTVWAFLLAKVKIECVGQLEFCYPCITCLKVSHFLGFVAFHIQRVP